MKTIKTTILAIFIVASALLATVLIFGEPVENTFFDTFIGLVLMKLGGFALAIFSAWCYTVIPMDYRKRFESWVRLHF